MDLDKLMWNLVVEWTF